MNDKLRIKNLAPARRSAVKAVRALLAFVLAAMFALPANAQQYITFVEAAASPVISLQLTSPARQIFPTFYPPENYTVNLQPGANGLVLNPGTWTATFGSSASYTFNVGTNNIYPAANSTNNWLSLLTNSGPAAFQTFGLTTNIAVTNLLTGTSNQYFFTNGVLCAIH